MKNSAHSSWASVIENALDFLFIAFVFILFAAKTSENWRNIFFYFNFFIWSLLPSSFYSTITFRVQALVGEIRVWPYILELSEKTSSLLILQLVVFDGMARWLKKYPNHFEDFQVLWSGVHSTSAHCSHHAIFTLFNFFLINAVVLTSSARW